MVCDRGSTSKLINLATGIKESGSTGVGGMGGGGVDQCPEVFFLQRAPFGETTLKT